MRRSLLYALAALAVAVSAWGCTGSKPMHPSASSSLPEAHRRGVTYVIAPLSANGRRGDLLAASGPVPAGPQLAGAQRYTLLYRSANARGAAIGVSGVLLVPRGAPPPGGWPIITWGHGTTGLADPCAPSERANLGYDEYAQEISSFLNAGYSVAATDYPGLGTPGVHSYLVGPDEGNALADLVLASRHRVRQLGTSWFAVGHSQGGQGVLFAARAANRLPGLRLGATIAIAPASGLDAILPAVLGGNDPSDVAYAIYALAGLATVEPSVNLADLLGPQARDRLPLLLNTACLEEADAAFAHLPPAEVFKISPGQVTTLSGLLDKWGDPDHEPVVGPVLVVQGADDTDVPAALSERLVSRLTALGSDVTLHRYPGQGHDSVLGPSICDQLAFLARHGGRPVGECQPHATATT